MTPDLTEVWAAFLALASDPNAMEEDRAAFWVGAGPRFSVEALAEVRQAVESFLAEHRSRHPKRPMPNCSGSGRGEAHC